MKVIIYTSIGDNINVININLCLFIPNLIPSVETQLMFSEVTQGKYKISYDEYYTKRRVIKDMIVQHDIGSAQQVNAPKYLISAHQTKERVDSADKNKNNAIFDHLNLRKFYIEIDSIRYPRDSLFTNYEENDYIEEHKNLKLIFKEYFGEALTDPFISYPDIETKYPIGIIDLGHQRDHITPKNIHLFQKYGADPDNARLFLILIRRREIELISDGNKLIDVKVI